MHESSEKLESYKKRFFLLQCDIERLKKSTKRLREEFKIITEKGTFGEIAVNINHCIRKGLLHNTEGITSILTTIAQNLPRKLKGHRYQSKDNHTYTDVFESAVIVWGASNL